MATETAGDVERTAANQTRMIAGVAAAHWLSHVHILVLPPLFPVLMEELGVGFVEVGFAVTIFGLVSALTQAPMGVIVDRLGAKRILLAGLCLGGSAYMLLALNPSYTMLLVCAAFVGLANSVYHPADYAILSSAGDTKRMGRAFSLHTFAGLFGGAMAPLMMSTLVVFTGLSWTLFLAGLLGPLVALLIVLLRVPDSVRSNEAGKSGDANRGLFGGAATPAILMLMFFFMMLGLSNGGINNFGVPALTSDIYGFTYLPASWTLTLFLGAMSAGVLAGGSLADKTTRHGEFAAACFACNAMIILTIALTSPPWWLLVAMLALAGFLSGVIAPSRDMLVRKAAPEGAAGRAFGIVSTGFNLGAIVGPMIYGWIMDQSTARWMFAVSAMFMLMTVVIAYTSERRGPSGSTRPGPA